MIDLHLHLDGSLAPEQVISLARLQGVSLPAWDPQALTPYLTVPPACKDLNGYLRCFDLPVSVLQSFEALYLGAEGLARRLAGEGLAYGEIRFAPQLHLQRGLSQAQAVEAVLQGLKRAEKAFPSFRAQAILCCMRGGEESLNRETVDAAARFLGQGVCALDLAGAEALYPAEGFRALFARAASLGVPFTLHAGEAAGPESVWQALSLGAARIGHGVRSREDPRLVERLAHQGIPLELCPTSNVQTRAVEGFSDFPLREYLGRGIAATLNTDNRTVSGTTLLQEYRRLSVAPQEALALLRNSVRAAFLPAGERQALRQEVDARWQAWLSGGE